MVDRSDSERLRGFCDGLMDRQTDICDSRVAFATENNILGGKPTHGKLCMFSADNFRKLSLLIILPSFSYNADKGDCDDEYYHFIHFLQSIGVK